MLANHFRPSLFEQYATWPIFKWYVSLLYGWFLLSVAIRTTALSAPCSLRCPRANVHVSPGSPKARDFSLSLSLKPTYMSQNFALVSLIKLVMGLDMTSSVWRPSCHGHMLFILHDIFACTSNPLYMQKLAFVLASQASHCLLSLCACKNSRANAKAGQKSLWDSQFS